MDPEESINYETGVRWDSAPSWGRLMVETIGFYNDYENLVSTCTASSGCDDAQLNQQFNGGEVDILGAELVVDLEIDTDHGLRFPVALTYTFTSTEFQTDFASTNPIFGDVEEGDELPYVPEHQASLTVGVEGETWGLATSVTYVGEMRDTAGQGDIPDLERIEDHTVLDLRAWWEPFEEPPALRGDRQRPRRRVHGVPPAVRAPTRQALPRPGRIPAALRARFVVR